MSSTTSKPYKLPRPSFPLRQPLHTKASTSITDFQNLLQSSTRILALCGAGLSASSGLDTFRGAGGMWRNHRAMSLATPEAFERDPGLVWLFYSYRRHKALQAKPNKAHLALAELARRKDGFVCLTQNVDGLSQRANHPPLQLKLLHGSLFDIKCFACPAIIKDNYEDPFHPSLAITSPSDDRLDPSRKDASSSSTIEDSSISPSSSQTTPIIPPTSLPHCSQCKTGLLRPGVVWFNEQLPTQTLSEIDEYISAGPIDLILVIGTTATVYPAAGYVQEARERGARVAVVNFDDEELGSASDLGSEDFLFLGDAAEILPELLKGVVGELDVAEKQ